MKLTILRVLTATGIAAGAWQGADVASEIRHAGYRDFAAGKPGNSGFNLFVSHTGRVEVINRWDLNLDGYNDVLISNDHDNYEVVDAFIYWNTPSGFRSLLPELWRSTPLAQIALDLTEQKSTLTRLPAFGGGRSAVADLNRDGYPDIVFCNYIHNYPGLRHAYVYWGGRDGYQPSRKTELPTNWASGVVAVDLNGDGYPELVFANHASEAGLEEISKDLGQESYIYWGSATGFDPAHPGLLKTHQASDVAVGDVNHDGLPDLIFVNNGRRKEVQVFLGSRSGYSGMQSQALPVPDATSVRSGDVNGDGFADVVVTSSARSETIYFATSSGKKADRAVYVFRGGPNGLEEKPLLLPGLEGQDSAIGDFNGDGFADIAVANSSDGDTTTVPSFVYWGSAGGFDPARRTELPTLGARGVAVADLNGDGRPDLVFANSNDAATYDVPSYIYWGGPNGFAPYLRSSLQGFGSTSVQAADLNGDGKAEIVLLNEYSGRYRGDVNTEIFWGNPDHYYSPASMSTLPRTLCCRMHMWIRRISTGAAARGSRRKSGPNSRWAAWPMPAARPT
ncbi:MAG: VCBS repeat-containing protein [Acidobacteria bacterium]|nr:VCBS repeat-containing protein [Acidobacteriota bacterium]